MSSMGRGQGGMQRTSAPLGPNMYDQGAASKVGVNTQPYNNERLLQQNVLQNTTAAAPQANANAVSKLVKVSLLRTTLSTRQIEFKNRVL